jgi:serine/threonine protein kinase
LRLDLHSQGSRTQRHSQLIKHGFSELHAIGSGTSGVISLARRVSAGDLVAVKRAKMTSPEAADSLRREYELLARLNHANIVRTLELVWADETPHMIMHYVRGKPLSDIVGTLQSCLDESVGRKVSSDLCDAVDYINQLGIVHRDIIPSNVILSVGADGRQAGVLVDFGTAREPRESVMLSQTGAADYRAPEMAFALPYGPSVDVWGVGATVCEAMSGVPFSSIYQSRAIVVVDAEEPRFSGNPWIMDWKAKLPPGGSADFVQLALALNPSERATARQLSQHPFLASR